MNGKMDVDSADLADDSISSDSDTETESDRASVDRNKNFVKDNQEEGDV